MTETKIELVDLQDHIEESPKPKRTRKPRKLTEDHKEKLKTNAKKARDKLVDIMKKGRTAIDDEDTIDLEAQELQENMKKEQDKHEDMLQKIKSLLSEELDKRENARLERLEKKRLEREEKIKNKPPKPIKQSLSPEEIKNLLLSRDTEIKNTMHRKYQDTISRLKNNINF